MRARRPVAIALCAAGLTAGALLGCFSERSPAAVEEGECRFPAGEGIPGSTVVVVRGFAFGPSEVRVRPGERVTWVNCAEDAHTSTADGGEWDSPLIAPGNAFTRTFETAGEFPYHCTPHPFMTGRVLVE
jgi:plastocyanin